MKLWLSILCVALLIVVAGCNKDDGGDNTSSSQGQDYGAGINRTLPVKEIGFALYDDEALNKSFTFEGTIASQCESDGCWLILSDGTEQIRVDLKPGGFVLPQLPGQSIKVSGTVVQVDGVIQIQASGITVY